jgi:hypothetical protein
MREPLRQVLGKEPHCKSEALSPSSLFYDVCYMKAQDVIKMPTLH